MRRVHAIQQAMVQMLLDPAFVERVLAGPVPSLTEPERALLLAVDPRAWSTDGYRRSRAVHALIDEYPATTAVIGVAQVDAFFSSEAFARSLAERGSLALDFGAWARAGELALLERTLALARRRERPTGAGVVTRPGLEPLVIGAGTLAAYTEIRASLGPEPLRTLARARAPTALPKAGEPEFLLVDADADGNIALSGASEALVDLVRFCCEPRSRQAVEARAQHLGCDPREASELIDELIADATLLLRAGSP